jgi:hypothetical protein
MVMQTEEHGASSAAQDSVQQQQQQQEQQQQLQQQQQQNGFVQPYIGWDLTLHPHSLNKAYWRERAPRYSQWDSQVQYCCSHNPAHSPCNCNSNAAAAATSGRME